MGPKRVFWGIARRLKRCVLPTLSHVGQFCAVPFVFVFFRLYYRCLDALARRRGPLLTRFNLGLYARGVRWHPQYSTIMKAKQFGMLHPEVMLLLRYCALRPGCGVLEIGAYVGGSTVIIAEGVRAGGGTYLAIEQGGKNQHAATPSQDVFADLQNNVGRFGVSDAVTLLHGKSDDRDIRQAVEAGLRPSGINLCFMDADGRIYRDVENFGPLLNDGCVLVVDDYGKPGAVRIPKMLRTMPWIDQEVSAGRLTQLGVFGYGTWVGLYRKSAYAAIPFPAPPSEQLCNELSVRPPAGTFHPKMSPRCT